MLLQCVSADLAMRAGLAAASVRRFGRPAPPPGSTPPAVGSAFVQPTATAAPALVHLVTKRTFSDKPLLPDLFRALDAAVARVRRISGAARILLPRIGCGADLLDWATVRPAALDRLRPLGLRVVVFDRAASPAPAALAAAPLAVPPSAAAAEAAPAPPAAPAAAANPHASAARPAEPDDRILRSLLCSASALQDCAVCQQLAQRWSEAPPSQRHLFDRLRLLRDAVDSGIGAHQSIPAPGWELRVPADAVPVSPIDPDLRRELDLLCSELPALINVPATVPANPPSLLMSRAVHHAFDVPAVRAALGPGATRYSCSDSGVRLPWASPRRPSHRRVTQYDRMPPAYRAAFDSVACKAMWRDLFEIVEPDSLRSAALLFLVFQGSKARLCADDSFLTTFLLPATCRYEDAFVCFSDPNTKSFVIADQFGAFQRVLIDLLDRPFLGGILKDARRVLGLRYKRAPFGISHAPGMWEAGATTVTAIARGIIRPLPSTPIPPPALAAACALPPAAAGDRYVDDHQVPCDGFPHVAVRRLRRLLAWFSVHDCPPALDKLFPLPCVVSVHKGLAWHAVDRSVRVTPGKAERLRAWCVAALAAVDGALHLPRSRPALAAAVAAVRKVAGLLSFFSMAVRAINLFRGSLDDFIVEADLAEGSSDRSASSKRALRAAARRAQECCPPSGVSSAALAAVLSSLTWWRERAGSLPLWAARRFCSSGRRAVRIVSDASGRAWGALVWLPTGGHFVLFGSLSSSQRGTSSGFRETVPLPVVLRYLLDHSLLVRGDMVELWTDSKVATSYTTRWSSPDEEVLRLLTEAWELLRSNDIGLETTWCSRDAGWIPLSDLVSKALFAPSPEYAMPPHHFDAACSALSIRPEVDLFASAATTRLPAFCARSLLGVEPASIAALAASISHAPAAASSGPSPALARRDLPAASLDRGWLGSAFAIPWVGRTLYAFPPWSQVPLILAHWGGLPSGQRSALLLILKGPLFHLCERHPDLAASNAFASPAFRLLDPVGGKPCPDPPPWPMAAFLLRR